MRPTGRGVRFTRDMARGFSRLLAKGASSKRWCWIKHRRTRWPSA